MAQLLTQHSSSPEQILLIGGPDVDARLPLMALLKADFTVAAVGSEPQLADRFAQANFDYHSYRLDRGSNPLADFNSLRQLRELISNVAPTIVHTFDTKPGVWGRLAAKQAGVPIIIGTIPGLGSLYTYNNLKTKLIRTIYRPLQRAASRASTITIFQNPDDRDTFVDEGIVTPAGSHIIPGSGIDLTRFSPDLINEHARQAVRDELGIPPNTIIITMITRLIKSKGIAEFAAAAQQLTQQQNNIRFLLVGPTDDDSSDPITNAEKQLLHQFVTQTGPRNDIPVLLAISDIVTLPSYYREGIPRVLLEAGAMGCPIVTTDSPGCRETVVDGQNGFLIQPRDPNALASALHQLITSSEQRLKFGNASRQHIVANFTLEQIAKQTTSLYKNLLQRRSVIQ